VSYPTSLAQVAALIGERARGEMLLVLMSGRTFTAKELAYQAGVTPQTASEHLAKLVQARILTLTKQGRFRYFRLASPAVAGMIESIMRILPPADHQVSHGADRMLAAARLCYDHLAGQLAVSLADWLTARRYILLEPEGGEVTLRGARFFADFGIDVVSARKKDRIFCRPCLDWTERRFHLAGAIGAALTQRCFQLRWVRRIEDSRALAITPVGVAAMEERFGIRCRDELHREKEGNVTSSGVPDR
jgi:DNA-binding transcriptional ArsR family regulator